MRTYRLILTVVLATGFVVALTGCKDFWGEETTASIKNQHAQKTPVGEDTQNSIINKRLAEAEKIRIKTSEIRKKILESYPNEQDFHMARERIKQVHIGLNNMLANGSWSILQDPNHPNWSFFKENKNVDYFVSELKLVSEKTSNEYLKKDIERAINFLKRAAKERKVFDLLMLHRIVHDLDYFVFREQLPTKEREQPEYFGVTMTLLKQ